VGSEIRSQIAVGRQLKYHKLCGAEVKVSGLTAVTPAVGSGKGFQDWVFSNRIKESQHGRGWKGPLWVI